MVSFLDLNRIHEPLMDEFITSFRSVVSRSAFINGPEVKAFEEAFASWVGTKYCVGVSSGLDAEVIGLRAMGVKRGDRVVAPAMTFIATIEAISSVGAEPVLVDVDQNGLIDLDQVEAEFKKGAKYVLPVHLFGQLVNPGRLTQLAEKYGCQIFEDACQAHGAYQGTHRAGAIGKASGFSFYPGKNLGALGDGGALCTNDEGVYHLARSLREHGQTKKYVHEHEGYTARLDTIQAAFLSTKLKHMDAWTTQRIEAARYYYEKLSGMKLGRFQSQSEAKDGCKGAHVYHLFVLLTPKREELSEELKKRGIGFGYHYPTPIHQLGCYKQKGWNELKFPNSELFASQVVSLPMFPGITRAEQDQVIEGVRAVLG